MSNRQPFLKRFIALYALLAALTVGGIFFATVANDASTAQGSTYTKPAIPPKPVSLVGNWKQTKGMPGVTMTAEVSGDSIQINMRFDRDDMTGIFWMGSFDASDQTATKFTVTSLPDPDARKALAGSLFGSSEKTKKFHYDDGDLSFEFSMMGVESTVHMTRK